MSGYLAGEAPQSTVCVVLGRAWREMSEVDLGHVVDSGAACAGSRSPIMGSGDGDNGMIGSGGVTAEEVGGIALSAVQEGRESSAAPLDPPEQGFPGETRERSVSDV